ncbi:hypothetical protein PV417_24780 [Streptomyces sp. ME19-03-3]|nr:hypothetical protein [Streptomyces sp. ME19-03-3]
MFHYRESKAGKFYLERDPQQRSSPSEIPPFLRFASRRGVALDLWKGEGKEADPLLASARLDWTVEARDILAPIGHGNRQATQIRGYRALVRPDTEQVMSVVTSAYSVAENEWVVLALERLCQRFGKREPILAIASFGHDAERTMFAGFVKGDQDEALCLLAYNTHGGEGAVRFQLVEVSRSDKSTFVLDSAHASLSIPHVGRVQDRLMEVSSPDRDETFIERYLSETTPLWQRLSEALWTSRHTNALIKELWGTTPSLTRVAPNGEVHSTGEECARHPGHHLTESMKQISDAASAYVAVCDWIDNRSEACERGDFTKDRDERLALGAGNRHKQRAWRWIVDKAY